MDDSPMQTLAPVLKRAAPLLVAVVIGGSGVGYAVHAHHTAQKLAAQNEQANTALLAARSQLNDLTARVNALAARSELPAAQPVQPARPAPVTVMRRAAKPHAGHPQDRRLTRLQAELDAQGKEIEETRGDLANTRTELTGSIAHTHDELVVLEKRGERSYFEFDIRKSKQFQREGPVGVSLRKANVNHQYADLQLMVDDRSLVQKHVNLDQPVMFFEPDTEQPIQIVINDITRDHIHGYVSAPQYRKSELTAMSDAANAQDQTATADAQPPARKKLTLSQADQPQD